MEASGATTGAGLSDRLERRTSLGRGTLPWSTSEPFSLPSRPCLPDPHVTVVYALGVGATKAPAPGGLGKGLGGRASIRVPGGVRVRMGVRVGVGVRVSASFC